MIRREWLSAAVAVLLAAWSAVATHPAASAPPAGRASTPPDTAVTTAPSRTASPPTRRGEAPGALPGMPPVIDHNIYAAAGPNDLSAAARAARSLVYVPNSESNTVDVVNPSTYRVVEHFAVSALPQHVVPAWDMKTLYVTNDDGNSLTATDPVTGWVERTIPVEDPYNLYFTPNGRYAIVGAERLHLLEFYDPHTFRLVHPLDVPQCAGVDHMDFSADGRYLIASCEFAGRLIKVDVERQRVVGTLDLGSGAMPQDVKTSPDGSVFYVADMQAGGVRVIDARTFRQIQFIPTDAGAHGLYPSRDARFLYVSNRTAGSISVISFATRRVVRTWPILGGGTSDMGGVSADGRVHYGSRGATAASSTPSTWCTGSCSRGFRWERGLTACACGRSLDGTRSATLG